MKKRPLPNCRSRTLVREKFSRLSASAFPPCSQAVRPAPNAQPLSCQAVPQKLPPATKGKVRQHTTRDKAHGRLEERCIWTSTELVGYLDFPYAAQAFLIQRDTVELTIGQRRCETVYGITRLAPEKASSARLLELNPHPWCIENGLHYVRDVTFDEDHCRIRKPAGAHVRASLPNLALGLLRLAGVVNIAQGLRACARNFRRALRLLGLVVNWLAAPPSSSCPRAPSTGPSPASASNPTPTLHRV